MAVHEGNTGDTATSEVRRIREDFGLSRLVLVGDSGMQTKSREQAQGDQLPLPRAAPSLDKSVQPDLRDSAKQDCGSDRR